MFLKCIDIVKSKVFKNAAKAIPVLGLFCIFICCSSSDSGSPNDPKPPVVDGITNESIFGAPPDSIPKIFGKDIISITNRYEYGLAISPDYKEIYYTAEEPGSGLLVLTKREDGKWNNPRKPSFMTDTTAFAMEAFFNYEGNKLYFAQMFNTPAPKIYYVNKTASGWSVPVKLTGPVNNTNVFYATFSQDNTMYFTNVNEVAIYKSELVNGSYSTVERAGLPFGGHPSISPDENYIIFDYSDDIYVAFKNNTGNWGTPVKFGPQINTTSDETCPSLSPDGKYLFFARYNDTGGKSNIYWVSTSVIDKLR